VGLVDSLQVVGKENVAGAKQGIGGLTKVLSH